MDASNDKNRPDTSDPAGLVNARSSLQRPSKKKLRIYWGIIATLALLTTAVGLATYEKGISLGSPWVLPVLAAMGPQWLLLEMIGLEKQPIAIFIVCIAYFPLLLLPLNPHLFKSPKKGLRIGIQITLLVFHGLGAALLLGLALAF